jgi:bifunctional UDP-N-acetylglucosamine pyrophosphorylase/glucosamine-1-phosphate N-acetyltransferase
MDRLLIVPAAGRGSRLGVETPKALVHVAGSPMLTHLLRRHRPFVNHVVIVVAPPAMELFAAFVAGCGVPIDLVVQPSPTGMLDAIILARPFVAAHRPTRVAVTWCDQIALASSTVARLSRRTMSVGAPALVFPTAMVDRPYIHFDRDAAGHIVGVRQRREGDHMPERGETDMGLFDLSLDAYLHDLEEFSSQAATSEGTGERNFLPFIPWLAARTAVESLPGGSAIETVGINTPEELAAIEKHLSLDARSPK